MKKTARQFPVTSKVTATGGTMTKRYEDMTYPERVEAHAQSMREIHANHLKKKEPTMKTGKFDNLELFAKAAGFQSITLEFLRMMKVQPGAFARIAAMRGLDVSVGIAAKREFALFLKEGAEMFAPRVTDAPTEAGRIRAAKAMVDCAEGEGS